MSEAQQAQTVTVIGAGSWGGTIAQHLVSLGHSVSIWHRNRQELDEMAKTRRHPFVPGLTFDKRIQFKPDLKTLEHSDIVVIGVPSHGVREVVGQLKTMLSDTIVVNLAKGIENETLLRMSQVISQVGDVDAKRIVTLSGPSHSEEVAQKIPTTVVVAGTDGDTIEFIQQVFSSETLRVYTNTDIVGVELGGSVKNIIAIAAGVCDGLGFGDNTKAALIIRGMVEIMRLGVAVGAKPETMAGLSGVGDLIVTCFSRYSRNRYVGEEMGKGRKLSEILSEMQMVAEGVNTAKSIHTLMDKYSIEMPICSAVYRVLFEGEDPREGVKELMTRELAYEHENSPGFSRSASLPE